MSGECPAHGRPTTVGESQPVEALPDVRAPEGWKLGKHVAVGGSAVVYELIGPSPAILKWGRWRDRELVSRFAIEAEVLRAVGPPSTPALLAHGTADGWPYLVMENVGAETLAGWMSKHGDRGSFGEIVAILTLACGALERIHAAGYVHRDLKPENICVTSRGVRVLDLGVAKRLQSGDDTSLTALGAVVGTPHYMAPEQAAMGGLVDQRADVYSLGVVAFEMLAGVPPFVGERRALEYQHQIGKAPSVRDHRDIPPPIDELVSRCLAKSPSDRPASAGALRADLNRALTSAGTLRGMGSSAPAISLPQPQAAPPLGRESDVALAWILGGEPLAVTRAIGEVQGMVLRQRGDGILAAFAAPQHEAPVTVALDVCRNLARDRCRVVVHATTGLVRRSKEGKVSVFGKGIQQVDDWAPRAPFVGLVLTPAAAERAKLPTAPASDVPEFLRERAVIASGTPASDGRAVFVGRGRLVENISVALGKPILVAISGEAGAGKSRVLEELAGKLRQNSRGVVYVRARERFFGDRPDDERVAEALERALAEGSTVLIDDVDRLSRGFAARVLAPMAVARVVTSSQPIVEAAAEDSSRMVIALQALGREDAGALLREQLRPAHLIPDVLIERLAMRGRGNPRMLLALANDVRARGAVRRSAGNDQWYVASDQLDTQTAAPGPTWLAEHVLETVPAEVADVLRVAAALGPRFTADELGVVSGGADVPQVLGFLQRRMLVNERGGWYELESPGLRDAIYELDDRSELHARALGYWTAHDRASPIGRLARLAFHAHGCNELDTAAASWITLARAASERGELDLSAVLLAQATSVLGRRLPPGVQAAIAALED